jgi:serine/threonine protein kinase
VKQQAGTPGYVSPEVIERKTHGKPVDMWAMGVVLFMLLGGYPPFYEPDNNTKNMYRRIIMGDYHFHPDYWAEISDEAKDLVRGCMTVDPTRRLTVDQALAHPWIRKPKEQFSLIPLTKNITALREYQRNRLTFKSANAAIAVATIDVVKQMSSAAFNLANLVPAQSGSNSPSTKSNAGGSSHGGGGSATSSIAGSVASLAMSNAGSTAISDVAIEVIRKISNTNLNADVIEAARKKSGVALASSNARRGSHNAGIPGSNIGAGVSGRST